VVGRPHEIKGEAVFAYVVTRGPRPTGEASALVKELRDWVGQQLGPIAKPDDIRFADNLPKTRSGKIMRRLLKAIARGDEITQDVSTLENPAILDQLRGTDTAGATSRPPGRGAAVAVAARAVRSAVRNPRRAASPAGAAKPKRAKTKGALARAAKGKSSAAPLKGRGQPTGRNAKPARRSARRVAAKAVTLRAAAKRARGRSAGRRRR
jgi:hypothetical protein